MKLISELEEFLSSYKSSYEEKGYDPSEEKLKQIEANLDPCSILSHCYRQLETHYSLNVSELIRLYCNISSEQLFSLSNEGKMKIYRIFDKNLLRQNIEDKRFYFFFERKCVPMMKRTEYLTTGEDVNSFVFVPKENEMEVFHHLKKISLLMIAQTLGIKKSVTKEVMLTFLSYFSLEYISFDPTKNKQDIEFFSDSNLSRLLRDVKGEERKNIVKKFRDFYRSRCLDLFERNLTNLNYLKEYFYLYEENELVQLKKTYEKMFKKEFERIKKVLSDLPDTERTLIKKIHGMLHQLQSFEKRFALHKKGQLNTLTHK